MLEAELNEYKDKVIKAALDNDSEAFKTLLAASDQLINEQRFALFMNALVLATKNDSTSIVSIILDSCSNLSPDQKLQGFYTKELREALIIAARHGYAGMIKIILASSELMPEFIVNFLNAIDDEVGKEDTALIAAARNGDVHVMQGILQLLNFTQEHRFALLTRENAQGETALMLAACNENSVHVFEALLESGSLNYNLLMHLLTYKDQNGKTAWRHVIDNQDEAMNIMLSDFCIETLHAIIQSQSFALAQVLFKSVTEDSTVWNNTKIDWTLLIGTRGINQESHLLDKLNIHWGLFINAVLSHHVDLVKKILFGCSPEQVVILFNRHYKEKTAIRFAQENEDKELYAYLTDTLRWSLEVKDGLGETLFFSAARNRDVELFDCIIESLDDISPAHEHKLHNLTVLLLQCNNDGKTALIYALENQDQEVAAKLFDILHSTMHDILYVPKEFIDEKNKVSLIKDLLRSFPFELKFEVLDTEHLQRDTLLRAATYFELTEIVKEMFSGLTIDQAGILLNKKDKFNKTLLGLAKITQNKPLIAYLNQVSSILAVNTHSAIVHDSVARSIIALSSHYLELSPQKKDVLKSWVDSVPGAADDEEKRQAMLKVIQTEETQLAFVNLMQSCEEDINSWIEELETAMQGKEKAAARGLRLMETPSFTQYHEAKTRVTLMQVLALTWIGIHDEQERCSPTLDWSIQRNDRKAILIDALFEAQRDGNLTNGKDLDPYSQDRSKCQDGFVNNIINSLQTLHSHVKVVTVNKELVKTTAMSLVASLFNSNDYTEAELREIECELDEEEGTCLLTQYVQENLRPKVERELHVEYDRFVEQKFLRANDIPDSAQAAVRFNCGNSNDAVNIIKAKLANYLRVHPKPAEASDDECCDHENKKPRLNR